MADIIDGVSIRMGGKEWVVPPLTFRALRNLRHDIQALAESSGALPGDEAMDGIIEIVHTAMKRNYPELTRDEIEDMLDIANMQHVIAAIMGASGLVAQGEAKAGN
ncbi:MAG: hypothetical protein AB1400_08835 [Pseudomonadota bacterium]|jgi:hypothetical protein